jgi:RNA polymerase sigma factor (sigma-70 family)
MWVLRVATNTAINRWKRQRREVFLGDDQRSSLINEQLEHLWIEWGLDRLSPRQRASFVLHHVQGIAVRDVADLIGTTESSVKTHLRRAVSHLRKTLGSDVTT